MTQQADYETRQLRAHLDKLDQDDALHEAILRERDWLEGLTVLDLLKATHGFQCGAALDDLLNEMAEALVWTRRKKS